MADIDPSNPSAPSVEEGRRAAARDSLFLSATIRRPSHTGEEPSPVRVRNLSADGMMADYHEPSVPGDAVVVTLRGIGSVAGKVAWVGQGRIGIAFDVEVDPKLARKPVATAPRPLPPPLRPIF
ncbi:MAG: PilZ protein [Alphaproteobacteria bacterium]|nr:PilZ protein [Alphaproteobacteria bacterium]